MQWCDQSMAKRGPKPKEVDPKRVEELARSGHQQHEIAAKLGVSHDTYWKRMAENTDIAEAYKKGREFFLEYIRKTRSQNVLEALDDLIAQRNPAAVIFASKTILGLQENIQITHAAAKDPTMTEERLEQLEARRRLLMTTEAIDAVSAKEPDSL